MIRSASSQSTLIAARGAVILLLVAGWVGAPGAYGQTIRNWTNNDGDNDWFNSDNWSPTGQPLPGDWRFVDFGSPATSLLINIAAGGIVDISNNADVTFGSLEVGVLGEGTLAMSGTSSLSTFAGTIGPDANSSGQANLTGDTTWNLSETLTVGAAGHGTLNITGGAEVDSGGAATFGHDASGTGIVHASGLGSRLEASDLRIGHSGSGTLNINNEAVAEAFATTWIGGSLSDATGSVTVDGGAVLTGAETHVGGYGLGALEMFGGGQASATSASIGTESPGVGRVLVDGSSSLWDVASTLEVGNQGVGELEVRKGGRVQSGSGSVGENASGTGQVLIAGPSSTWSSSGALTVGNFGDGNVRVERSGSLESASGIIAQGAESNASVTIDGYGSTWTNTGTLEVGQQGGGELVISGGATVSNTAADLGESSGAVGTVNVLGAGSRWTNNGTLIVGRSGVGHLDVRDAARVTSAGGVISLSGTSAFSTATIDGDGSHWTTTSNLQVGSGNGSDGTLNVTGGGSLSTAGDITIGNGTGSAGHVTVNGTGSAISVDGALRVGNAGAGDLTVDGGADVTVGGETSIGAGGTLLVDGATLTSGSLSQAGGGTLNFTSGTVTIDGGTFQVGSIYTLDSATLATLNFVNAASNTGDGLIVGGTGNAVANFTGGSTFTGGAFATIGDQAGSDAAVNVSGAGSEVMVTDELIVGDAGTGTLDVSDHAATGSELVIVGGQTGGDGTVNLNTGSSLTAVDFELGLNGAGALIVADDASATVTSGFDIGSNGQVVIDGGTLQINGGTANAGAMMQFTSGTLDIDGTLSFFSTNNPLVVPTAGQVNLSGGLIGQVASKPGSTVTIDDPAAVMGDSNSLVGINLQGRLEVGGSTLALNSLAPARLGELTTLSTGGLLRASAVALGEGDVLEASGAATVDGRVLAGVGSLIRGPLTLGDAAAFDGFVSDGIAQTLANTMTLLDANEATLGSLTEIGLINPIVPSFSTPGTLEAANGAVVEFGKTVTGYGTLDTPDDPATPLVNNGHLQGESASLPITLTGYVKGVGTADNVVITGTDAPGFSPAAVNRGSVVYDGTLQIEIGGTTPGSGHDRLNHVLGAGLADLGGQLDLLLVNGFTPASGDVFEILTAASITGAFDNVADGQRLDTLGGEGSFLVNYDGVTNQVVLSNFLLAALLGDMDCDGDVDFDDIDDFVLGLNDPQQYENQFGVPAAAKGDADEDGDLDFDDIDDFVGILNNPSSAASQTVPEPGTATLVCAAMGLLAFYERPWYRLRNARRAGDCAA